MAFLFGCENVHLEYPTKVVFESLSLGVDDGDHIGVVGRNGDGKSSLLGLFDGSILPDDGRVIRTNGVRVVTLRQRDELDDNLNVAANVVGNMPEHEWAGNPEIRAIIDGLIGDLDWEGSVANLSGGERRRVDLARVLVADADVLLLDEPTNHLDVNAINWLAEYLKRRFHGRDGAFVVVTHDRWFLDEVCERMWEVHDGIVDPFEGGYSAYVLQRVERDRQAALAEQKRRNLARRELAWLSRGARARSTKPKFHVKAAQELIASEPPIRNTVELKRAAIQRLGKRCVDVEDVSFSYGSEPILQDVTWRIGPGDRYALLGTNGVGKSTLLDIVRGLKRPSAGRVNIGKTVKFAFLSQRLDELEELADDRVREVLARHKTYVVVEGKEVSPSQLLEQLGFEKKALNSQIKDLSGGQKRRLQLMLILLDSPNVLILDEPSNDLDTDMMVAMENVLDSWPGTLIVVSHDRYLVERVTDDQFALIDGKLLHMPRGVDGYLEILHSAQNDKGSTQGGVAPAQQSNEEAQQQASTLSGGELHKLRKRQTSLEGKMETMQARIAEAQQAFLQVDPADYMALQEAQANVNDLQEQLANLEEEWFEVSELLS